MKSWMAVLVCAVGFCGVVRGADIFVSPSGDDGNAGTMDRPVRTVEHARDLARGMTSGMNGDLVINLMDGTYRLSEPLVLTAADSGTGGHDVVYRAVHGGKAIISGGLAVTGWT